MGTSWSAGQYSKYEAERTRPVRDLLAAIPTRAVRAAIDLGCGPGNSTELLAAQYRDAVISGVDSSEDMLAAARRRLPHLHFERADLATWRAPPIFDVILANAVLQWLPDHATLLPALVGRLSAGGSLALQVPDNLAEPVQRLMQHVAAQEPWRERLAGAGGVRTPIEDAGWYYTLLRPACSHVEVWRTIYYHPLPGVDGIVDWFSGSGLRPYLDRLRDAGERADFLNAYTSAVRRAYPPLADGTVLLAMPRLFIIATR